MTPPEVCLNCHGNSYTTEYSGVFESSGACLPAVDDEPVHLNCLDPLGPELLRRNPVMREHWRRMAEEQLNADSWFRHFGPIPLPPVTSTDDIDPCPVEERWPEWLSEAQPVGQRHTWWVRANYEALRSEPAPYRIDLNSATLHAEIALRSGAALPLVRGWVDLLAGDDARIVTDLEVTHNQLDLLLARLLDFQNVEVDLPVGEIPLDRISTGDFGGLHAIGEVPTWLMFFIQPFMVPNPPAGYDHQTFAQFLNTASYYELLERCMSPGYAFEQVGICPQGLRYPDRRPPTSALDLNLWALLPESLRCRLGGLVDEDERLPQFFNLEDLLRVIREMPARDCAAGNGGGMNLEDILNFVRSGSLEIRLEELNDFFIPGVLDLGPSSGVLRVYLSEEHRLDASLEEFEIELEPMGYGASRCAGPEASLSPSAQLHWASLTPGPETEFDPFLDPGMPVPGIHLSYDLNGDSLEVVANLHLQGEITLPLVGPAYVEADLSATLHAKHDGSGSFRLAVGGNQSRIVNLLIQPRGAERALLSGMQIELSDSAEDIFPTWHFSLVGGALQRGIEVEGTIPLVADASGYYDWSSLEAGWGVEGEASLGSRGGETISGAFEFSSEPSAEDGVHLPTSRDYRVAIDADRRLASRRGSVHPLIRAGLLEWSRLRASECQEEDHVTLSADLFRWGEFLVNGVLLRVIADEISISPTESRFRIAELSTTLNGAGPSSGPVRGEVRVEQNPNEPLEFVWMGPERHLTMDGLDISLSAQRLYVLPDALVRSLDTRVTSLGIDGHLSGGLDMYFPNNPRCTHGEGDLLLSGDRNGDIYYLDAAGRRVGAPLFRSTRWRFNQVNWINTRRGYGLGRFSLATILNLSAAPGFSAPVFYSESADFGELRTGGLGPYELSASMVYNNQPILPAQFRNRIEDYLLNLYLSPDATFSSSSLRLPRECRETEGDAR